MTDNKKFTQLIPIDKQHSKYNIILSNVIRMLTNRKWLNEDNLSDNLKKYGAGDSNDMIYKIKMDKTDNDKFIYVKILSQNITAVNKSSGISEFLVLHKNDHVILIATIISKKASNDISVKFPKTELFVEHELMLDLASYSLIPKHELLPKDTIQSFFDQYNVKKRDMSRIFIDDPMARYYNAKDGDIFKITRPSETAGFVNSYRIVVKGSIFK